MRMWRSRPYKNEGENEDERKKDKGRKENRKVKKGNRNKEVGEDENHVKV